jgi:2-enoate reductase
LTPAPKKKKILIVGGGVAGLEAARVCAIRGHGVTLFEKAEKLGGNLIPGGMPDFKEDDHALVRWYELQLKKLGVDVQTGTEVTKELLQKSDADEIILATGSKPKMLQVPGVEMLTAEDVLNGRRDAGMSTVIIGGGLVGCETALYLKQSKGTDVTIVELQSSILSVGGPLCAANTEMLLDLMKFHKIRILSNSCVTGKSEDGYTIKTANGEVTVATESVICAIGYNSEKSLYQEVRDQIPYVHLLGDAENVSNIMYAIWNAYELARNI